MPKKTATKDTVTAAPVRVAKPKTVTAVASKPRVKTVKHSKAAAPVVVETAGISSHDHIAQIAYGYWEARGHQHGSSEQDWLRAEQEYLLSV